MIKEHSFENVKAEAAELGAWMGRMLRNAGMPKQTLGAWLSVLPHVDLDDVETGDEAFNSAMQSLRSRARLKKFRGNFDLSTAELLLREYFLKQALHTAGAAQHEAQELPAALQLLSDHHGVSAADLPAFVRKALPRVAEQSSRIRITDPILLRPPQHMWDGPQPGLYHQSDERHRYVFSERNGKLMSVVQYDEAGQPHVRVRYKQSGPHEVESWRDGQFITLGILDDAGEVVPLASLPRRMYDVHGALQPIPEQDPSVFVTPAGLVIRMDRTGSLLRAPEGVYIGRVEGFDPMQPYVVRTVYGEVTIAVDRRDVVIAPSGHVFEITNAGLQAIGELVLRELARTSDTFEPFEAVHDLFVVRVEPRSVRMSIQNTTLGALGRGPLHVINGQHAFLHDTVPELVDVHGSTAAEEQLRRVEQKALEVGLLAHALQDRLRSESRAGLMRAMYMLEEELWSETLHLERVLGALRHSIINPAQVRGWIQSVAENPFQAVASLKQTAREFV